MTRGLTALEAAARLTSDGPNELPVTRAPSIGRRLARHAVEPLSLVLLAAAVLSAVVLGHLLEGAAIATIVAVNVGIGALQEDRADRAVAALGELTAPAARVRRDGATASIDARQVVVGDIVELAAGDRVPADAELVEAATFAVDEAILTGESLPVAVALGGCVRAGTLVVRGRGAGSVVATGARTELGQIATALQRPAEPPLVIELRSVAKTMSIGAIVLGALLVPVAAWRGSGDDAVGDAVLAGIALAVAAIPEGLAAVVTISLAFGARAMVAHGAIVRRLPALETLGSTTVICTDKTGTLTTGQVAVVAVDAADEAELWAAAIRCVDADDGTGDPIDVAIVEAASAFGLGVDGGIRIASQPFDADARCMATITFVDGVPVLTVKGAPEVVLGRCQAGDAVATLMAAAERMSADGLRVLAVAVAATEDLDALGLRPVGLIGFADPLRPSTMAAVAACRAAGIRLVMVTGDHVQTAITIARQAGLEVEPAITGDAILAAPGDDRLLRSAAVIARVQPATKVALVHAHRAAGDVVAMTGDGVNDAPALRAADIGVAVAGSSGTDVAREAAGLVVTSGDLGTIVDAVREGRRVYRNVAQVVGYLLTGNLSEVLVVAGCMAVVPELAIPLLPVQLLWCNLVTDGLPALALGVDRATTDPLAGPPRRRDDRLLSARRFRTLAERAGIVAVLVVLSARWAASRGWPPDLVRTQLLLGLVGAHLLLVYVTRATTRTFEAGWWRNRLLLGTVTGSLLLQVALFVSPVGRRVLGLGALPPIGWAVATGVALGAVALIDLDRRRRVVTNGPS